MAKFPLKNVLEGTKHFWTKSQGPDAEGTAAIGNPIAVGYKDGDGLIAGVTPTNVLPVGDAAAQATLAAIQDYVDGLEIALGEVDANPTAYTVLARLKDLATTIGAVAADPAANTLLARIKALETKVDAIIADGIKLSGSNLAEAKVVNVTLPGTRQQLDDKPCHEVTIIAKRGNTGYIYVGKSTVSSTVYGAELGELDSITLEVSNTNEIYIDASVSGEGISYVAI